MNTSNRIVSDKPSGKPFGKLIVATIFGLGVLCATNTWADDHQNRFRSDRGSHAARPVSPRTAAPYHSAPAPRVHMQIDAQFGHNRYYPSVGASYRRLPSGYYTSHFHGTPYYYHGGVWYGHGSYGYRVIRPPAGLFINFLPPFYTTVWFSGIPYYYADNVYYRWEPTQSVYVVSNPPDDSTATTQPADNSDQTFVYPKNGQSEEQTAKDRYECYRWAADQTGFDPTKNGGGVDAADTTTKHDDYKRAEAACLDARGYSVK